MQLRWREREVTQADVVARLQRELNGLAEPLARLLVLRGIFSRDEARMFFRGTLDDLHDPFLMKDMGAAADRVSAAIVEGSPVFVFGDYDVDGATATALMVSFLRARGVPVFFHVPDRITEGYGLNRGAIDRAVEAGADLVVALDCGITAMEEAAYARARRVDLIICDHHTPGDSLPDALAVLDPKRRDCEYPFKELTGCGVGFKLVQAVLRRLGEDVEQAHAYLDLVAISSACDVVPVSGENRVIMREGFCAIEANPRPGLAALADCARLELSPCNTGKIGFGIGPRLNAAGRMATARTAVELLLASSAEEAMPLAANLERVNDKRRALDEKTLDEAIQEAEPQMPVAGLVLYRPEWHTGVIGIVASRIVERFYRPTVILCRVDGMVKGSARSVEGVNVYEAIKSCEDLLEVFGGHDYAAGMTMREEHVDAFTERFNRAIAGGVSEDVFTPVVDIDASLDLEQIDTRFWSVLKQFGPFGPSNARPIFRASDLVLVGRPRVVGRDGAHLKFAVRPRVAASGRPFQVIGFGLGHHLPTLELAGRGGRALEILFTIDENEWNGSRSLQLQARDLRPILES